MKTGKPPLKITEVLQAKVKITVKKTKKSYYHTRDYAKHVTKAYIGEPKEDAIHEYFLRDGRGWKKVTEEEFKKATSKESQEQLHQQLAEELRKRVEGIMSKE